MAIHRVWGFVHTRIPGEAVVEDGAPQHRAVSVAGVKGLKGFIVFGVLCIPAYQEKL